MVRFTLSTDHLEEYLSPLQRKMEIHERIIALAKANNTSQREIAEHCSVSKNTVNKWFLGEAKPTRGLNLDRLSELFHVQKSYIEFGVAEDGTEEHVISQKLKMLSQRQRTSISELIDSIIESNEN